MGRDDEGNPTIEFEPALYPGSVDEDFPEGRDRVMIPWPCYGLSMHIDAAASAGPVFDSESRVFGVNCSSMNGAEDASFATQIRELTHCSVVNGTLNDGVQRPRLMFSDLVAAGVIAVESSEKALPLGDARKAKDVVFTRLPSPGCPTLLMSVRM